MESEYEMTCHRSVDRRKLVPVCFIGDYTSRLYEVRMYDWEEKMVIFRQHKWGDVDGNVIVYSYVPKPPIPHDKTCTGK